MATLEAEIVHYLRDVSNGSSNAMRRLARESLRALVGDNIYHGRIPANTRSPYSIILKRLSTRRYHDLAGEDNIAHAMIQFTVLGNDSPATVQELCERHLRLALNSYRGTLGRDDTQVLDVTIDRDGMPQPGVAYEGSDAWKFAYSMDLNIAYRQESI